MKKNPNFHAELNGVSTSKLVDLCDRLGIPTKVPECVEYVEFNEEVPLDTLVMAASKLKEKCPLAKFMVEAWGDPPTISLKCCVDINVPRNKLISAINHSRKFKG